jgi:hypothetical protein
MRRIVATLLVVASPVLTAVAVGATEARPAGPAVLPPAPAVVQTPALPAPVTVAPPAAPAIVAGPAMPALPAPAIVAGPAMPALPAPAVAHRAAKVIRAKAPGAAPGVSDAAYAARLQAELCRARQIFCGLDHGGRYLAR